jgi:hypothetical protein
MGDFSCLFFLDCVRLAGVVAIISGPFLLGIVGLAPEEAKRRWLGARDGSSCATETRVLAGNTTAERPQFGPKKVSLGTTSRTGFQKRHFITNLPQEMKRDKLIDVDGATRGVTDFILCPPPEKQKGHHSCPN